MRRDRSGAAWGVFVIVAVGSSISQEAWARGPSSAAPAKASTAPNAPAVPSGPAISSGGSAAAGMSGTSASVRPAAPGGSPALPSSTPAGDAASNEMRAEKLFRSGEKKFDAGQYAEACSDFAESLRYGPKLGALMNLALCHETIGKVATAWREYQYSAAWAAQNGQRERHDFAMQHALALEPKLPRVLFHLPNEHAIASVEVDGEPLPDVRWYLPVFLDVGEHTVAVTAPGKARGTVTFRVTNAPTDQVVMISSLADEAPKPRVVTETVDPHRARRITGYGALGAAAVGTAVGLVFGGVFLAKRPGPCGDACSLADVQAERDAGNAAVVSTVGLVSGLVLGAVGAALVMTSLPKKESREGSNQQGRGAPIGLSFAPSRGGAVIGWSQTF